MHQPSSALVPAHRRKPLHWVLSLAVCCAVAGGPAAAAPLGVGASLPPLALQNQHGQPVVIKPGPKRLAFAADKAAGDLASAVLSAQPAGVLDRQQAVYIADVSAMPGLIFKMFALPKLRDLPFPVALVKDAAVTAELPREAGRGAVLDLDARCTVTRVQHAGDAAALQRALGIDAP